MYEKGQLKKHTACVIEGDDCITFETDLDHDCYINVEGDCAYLPHSCDEWVIGGKEQIEALIADLQEILKNLD